MTGGGIGRPYAEALLQTAPAGFDAEAFLAGVGAIRGALESNRALRAVLANPGIALDAKERIIAELSKKAGLDQLGARFVRLVLHKRRLADLGDILAAVRDGIDEREGIVRARVTVAASLDDAARDRVIEALSRRLGRRVRASFDTDPGLLAGFVARIGSEIYDASALGAIQKFKEEAYGN
jgi:F-type H+-transporting ATPase subunit delta